MTQEKLCDPGLLRLATLISSKTNVACQTGHWRSRSERAQSPHSGPPSARPKHHPSRLIAPPVLASSYARSIRRTLFHRRPARAISFYAAGLVFRPALVDTDPIRSDSANRKNRSHVPFARSHATLSSALLHLDPVVLLSERG